MNQLTAYFLTTDRRHADESLASLRAQEIPRDVVIIRNVRPLATAHLPTLDCETEFCLILDDDVLLKPGVVRELVDEFRRRREGEPRGFKLNARIFCEAKQRFGKGGLKLFHTASLREIGWPDAPHVSFAQREIADRLGFVSLKCPIEAGVQKKGSDVDLYKKYLWIELRARAGQLRADDLDELVRRGRKSGDRQWWIAALGTIDARALEIDPTSKDEDVVGPLGATLDLDAISTERLRAFLAEHGVAGAAVEAAPSGWTTPFRRLFRR